MENHLYRKNVSFDCPIPVKWWAVMGENWFIKREGTARTPVTRVSFYDARKFIRKLNQKGTFRFGICLDNQNKSTFAFAAQTVPGSSVTNMP
jgi:hypothetical protein